MSRRLARLRVQVITASCDEREAAVHQAWLNVTPHVSVCAVKLSPVAVRAPARMMLR